MISYDRVFISIFVILNNVTEIIPIISNQLLFKQLLSIVLKQALPIISIRKISTNKLCYSDVGIYKSIYKSIIDRKNITYVYSCNIFSNLHF